MTNELTTPQDVKDFLRGANFLSASGGGDPVEQEKQLQADLAEGLRLQWTNLEDLDPDALIVTACFSGSIAPEAIAREGTDESLAPGERIQRPMVAAIEALERELGRDVDGLISIEIGGINTGSILDAAAAMGKPLVNADYAGRAIPELNATTLNVFDVEVLPWASADDFGNEIVIRRAASRGFAERIGKHLAQASFGLIGCALGALPARRVAEISVHGTLTECLAIGRAIREAQENGADPVAAAATVLDGWVLFRGTVTDREWKNTGYMEGIHTIAGQDEFEGQEMKVWFKNENHVSWLNGEDFVGSPDLIEVCDAQSAEPLVNTYLEEGAQVAVVGMKRRDVWDSEAGMDSLGPAHFGWSEFVYRPIEDIAGDKAQTAARE